VDKLWQARGRLKKFSFLKEIKDAAEKRDVVSRMQDLEFPLEALKSLRDPL